MNEDGDYSPTTVGPGTEAQLMFYSVSLRKLVVMCICTFGLYNLFWQFSHWVYIRDNEKSGLSPALRGVFLPPVFCYPLFRRIGQAAKSRDLAMTIPAGPLASGWLICVLFAYLPAPFWLLYFLSILFLLPIQRAANAINAVTAPQHSPDNTFTAWNKVGVVLGGIFFALAVVGSFPPAK